MDKIIKWDKRFIAMAALVSTFSKDPSTKCGAIIADQNHRVISMGFNGFPAGISDEEALYHDRTEKYLRVIHAEKNAILFAARDLGGCTLYVIPLPPCSQCAGMIIQSGISRVVTIRPSDEHNERWGHSIKVTQRMFGEAGVEMEYF